MLSLIPFTQSPYHHNMAWVTTVPTQHCYSGRWIVHVQQWGVFVVNADTGAFKMKSPVGKNDPSFQPPSHAIVGDCWQSGINLAASPGAPAWVVVTGTPNLCRDGSTGELAGQIQVLTLSDSITNPLVYYGQIFAPKVNRVGGYVRIFGDQAYVRQVVLGSPPAIKWTLVDLVALAVVDEDIPDAEVPAYDPQLEIDGFTYSIVPIYPDPIPPDFEGPSNFNAVRSDTSTPPGPRPLTIPITVDVAPVPSPVDSLVQTGAGHDYTVPPTVTVVGGGGSGAVVSAVANMDGTVTLTLDNPGTGYVTVPTLSFTGGDGAGVAAHLVLPVPEQSVEYLVNNDPIGTVISPPYSYVWHADRTGHLKLEARLTRGTKQYSDFHFIDIQTVTVQSEGQITGQASLTDIESGGMTSKLITGEASLTSQETGGEVFESSLLTGKAFLDGQEA